ncbi:MAG: CarD family transcriptional regulator [Clostridia bacterium]|nr:CarD family transcriptional regulator [Clostridia bacterium]
MEFRVGDRVVYPMHGAGVIEAIEEREILGRSNRYYVMRLPVGDMQVLIPVDGVEEVGLRQVMPREAWDEVREILSNDAEPEPASNWNRRYRANAEKLKTGDVREVAEVVRTLVMRDREKGLSTGERKMLESARQILVSEIALACCVDEREALAMVESAIPTPSTA